MPTPPRGFVGAGDRSSRLGLCRIAAQAKEDLFGTKNTHDVSTASYIWIADEFGHWTYGVLSGLAICAIWHWVAGRFCMAPGWTSFGYVALVCASFGTWVWKERADLADDRGRAEAGVFPLDTSDIAWNVTTVLLYVGLGLALGLAAYAAPWWLLVVIPLTLWWGLAVAVWWLRRAIAFQQAGGPYLYRLATFKTPFAGTAARKQEQVGLVASMAALANRAVSLWDVCLGTVPAPTIPEPACRHLLVTGPLHSGKTSLVTGIVAEFAFAHGAARYLTPIDLLESLASTQDDTVPMEGIVTLTLDGRAGAQDGSAARIMSRIGRTSPVARHQMPRTCLHDMHRLPGDAGVDGSGHG